MRVPIRSEGDAFRLTIAGAAVVGAAMLIGWLTEAVVGAAAFSLAVALAAIAYLRAAKADRGTPLRDAAHEAHPHVAVSDRGTSAKLGS